LAEAGTVCDHTSGEPAHCNAEGQCIRDACTCEGSAICCADDCNAGPGSVGTTCEDDGLSCTTTQCNEEGNCVPTVAAGTCLIGGACYDSGDTIGTGNSPHCSVCTPEASQTSWSTPSGLTEDTCDNVDDDCNGEVDEGCDSDGDGYCDYAMGIVGVPAACPYSMSADGDTLDCNDESDSAYPGNKEICDGLDNDCDGETDEWPAGDGFEPNDLHAEIAYLELIPEADEVVSPSDHGETWFHGEDDFDYFEWTYQHATRNEETIYWMCRVVELQEGQTVRLSLEMLSLSSEPPWSVFDVDPDLQNGDVLSVSWQDDEPLGSQLVTLRVGVSLPDASGIDACDNSYRLECKVRYIGIWEIVIIPDPPLL
jgi:hypothetical protein